MDTYRRSFFTKRGIAFRQYAPGAATGGPPRPALARAPASVPAGFGRAEPTEFAEPSEFAEIDLIAGAIHYWRLDRGDWNAGLDALDELGIGVVHVSVPWRVHESAPGTYNWSGACDVGGFLDLVGARGMRAVVHLGPLVGCDLVGAGAPDRVLDDAAMHALTARGTTAWVPAPPRMFPLLSMASAGLQRQLAAWFAAVGAQLAPRQAPAGPLIAIELGPAALLGDRLGPFDFDYHPDALVWWREFADDQDPPRAWDDHDKARCAQWMYFRDHYLVRALGWMRAELHSAGLGGLAYLHSLPWSEPARFDLPGVDSVLGHVLGQSYEPTASAAPPATHSPESDAAASTGLVFGHRQATCARARQRALYLAGSASPLPIATQVATGGPALGVPSAPHTAQRALLHLLAAGARGFFLSMAIERTGWYGAPISEVGDGQPAASWMRRLLAALRAVAWTELRRDAPIALIATTADQHLALASSAAGTLSPYLDLVLPPGALASAHLARDRDAQRHARWLSATQDALALAQVPYAIVDERAPLDTLSGFRAVVAPTAARVSRALWSKLHALAERGVIVVIGPGRPERDEFDRPLANRALPARAGLIRERSATDLDGLADDLAAVAGNLPERWITAERAGIDCSLFVAPGGVPRVLFVANRERDACAADVIVCEPHPQPAAITLTDVLSGERFQPDREGIADIPIDGQDIRMLLIE